MSSTNCFDSIEELRVSLSKKIKEICDKNKNKDLNIAISGGSILKVLSSSFFYDIEGVDYLKWNIILADERIVDLNSNLSNYKEMKKILIFKESKIKKIYQPEISENSIPQEAAYEYTKKLSFIKKPLSIVIIGVGEDGHICSLFPGQILKEENDLYIGVVNSPKHPPKRISLSFDAVCKAENVFLIVTSNSKKEIIKKVFRKDKKDLTIPVLNLCSKTNVKWFITKNVME